MGVDVSVLVSDEPVEGLDSSLGDRTLEREAHIEALVVPEVHGDALMEGDVLNELLADALPE